MKTCIIHIGFHKTGSTALQQYCFQNSEVLAEKVGVHYFNALQNHSYINDLFDDDVASVTQNVDSGSFLRSKKEEQRAALKKDLFNQIRTCTTPYFMLSGEGFSKLSAVKVTELKSWLDPYFDDIQIVSFVRDHRSFLNSFVQQLTRVGITMSSIDPKTLKYDGRSMGRKRSASLLPNYQAVHEMFADIFGEEKMTILDYTKIRADGVSVVDSFFETVLGLTELPFAPLTVRANSSISHNVTVLIERINQHWPVVVDDKYNKKRGPIGFLHRLTNSRKGAFKLHEGYFDTEEFASLVKDDIEWLVERTQGRIDYRDIIPQGNFRTTVQFSKPLTDSENELLDISAEAINTLSVELDFANHRSIFFRECVLLRQTPTRTQEAIEKSIMGIKDCSFLLNAAHILRLEDRPDLAKLALENARAWVDADDDLASKISSSLDATQKLLHEKNAET